jgi:hypothetical protein
MERLSRGDHEWLICGADEAAASSVAPIACVVGPFSAEVPAALTSLVCRIAEQGCRWFAFVGPASEAAHDSFDWHLEERNLLDVVTAWHSGSDGWEEAVWTLYGADAGTVLCIVFDEDAAGELRTALAA